MHVRIAERWTENRGLEAGLELMAAGGSEKMGAFGDGIPVGRAVVI